MGSYKCDKYYGVVYMPLDNTGYSTPEECAKYCIKNPDGTYTPTSGQATVAGEENTNVSNTSIGLPSAVQKPVSISTQKPGILASIKDLFSKYFWYIVAIIFIIIMAYLYSGGKKE